VLDNLRLHDDAGISHLGAQMIDEFGTLNLEKEMKHNYCTGLKKMLLPHFFFPIIPLALVYWSFSLRF
jgi:hypothetical protein